MFHGNPYVVALIPARSGSKGIKDKNLMHLGGAPLISWSINCGIRSRNIQRIIVSTDSPAYAEVARKSGAEVPFIRPDSISKDSSTDLEFVHHALDFFKSEGRIPDLIVHLRPTTPIRDPLVVDEAIDIASNVESQISSLRSVHEMSESAYKFFELGSRGNLVTVFKHEDSLDASNLNRQSFPKTYIPNGYVDVLIPKFILSSGLLHGSMVKPFMTETAHEVDTKSDFELLEAYLNSNKDPIANIFGGI